MRNFPERPCLSEETLSKMPLHRLKNIRKSILAQIHKEEKGSGHWCCDMKCEWFADSDNKYIGSFEQQSDYAYRDIINKYYNREKEKC